MIRMPAVGLGGVTAALPLAVTAALPLAVTASKNREMITRIFPSCEDIVTLCQCGLRQDVLSFHSEQNSTDSVKADATIVFHCGSAVLNYSCNQRQQSNWEYVRRNCLDCLHHSPRIARKMLRMQPAWSSTRSGEKIASPADSITADLGAALSLQKCLRSMLWECN